MEKVHERYSVNNCILYVHTYLSQYKAQLLTLNTYYVCVCVCVFNCLKKQQKNVSIITTTV